MDREVRKIKQGLGLKFAELVYTGGCPSPPPRLPCQPPLREGSGRAQGCGTGWGGQAPRGKCRGSPTSLPAALPVTARPGGIVYPPKGNRPAARIGQVLGTTEGHVTSQGSSQVSLENCGSFYR